MYLPRPRSARSALSLAICAAALLLAACDAARVSQISGDGFLADAGGDGTAMDVGGFGCGNTLCITPPAPGCLDANTLRTYKESGTCDPQTNACVYDFVDSVCVGGCSAGKCASTPCDGVVCDKAPAATCANPVTLKTYSAPGTCTGQGVCDYPFSETSCPGGCKDGKCLTDPCAGIKCTTPDPPTCVNTSTLRSFTSPGSCKDKQCSYPHKDKTCPYGCNSGACNGVPGYTPLTPFRFLDTRGGAMAASGSTRCVTIAGKAGIPTSAKAVALNLVAVAPTGLGYLTAYPKGVALPGTSTLNYVAGDTIANGAIVKLGSSGQICVYTKTQTHVILDVSGYFPSGARYVPRTPYRRLDTRSGSKPGSESTRCLQVAGRDGIPASAKAVALNLVAVQPAGPGFFTAYPKGTAKPTASSLNYSSQNIANGALVKVGQSGQICVFIKTATHLIVDLSGYFASDAAYTPLTPYRKLDTRNSSQPGAGSTKCYQVAGVNSVPSTARAVAINIAAVAPAAKGFLTIYPQGHGLPGTSTLNYPAGVTRGNNALVQPGTGGKICIYTLKATDYIVDVSGYWPASNAGDPCAGVSCNSPPPATCVGGDTLVSYASPGSCIGGTCVYTKQTKLCPAWCSGTTCQQTFGWDYNLTHRCAASLRPQNPNYFTSLIDCPKKDSHWMVGVNAERSLGVQCQGVQDQALPINAGGPLTFGWQPHTDEFGRANWIANIKTDVMSKPHPCGSGVYTFFDFGEHLLSGGGPYPSPAKLIHRVNVKYDDWTPNGASRAVAWFAGKWNGKGVWLEIDLASKNWGDAYPSVGDIVQVYKSSSFLWVEMYGPGMGVSIPRKAFTKLTIQWPKIINNLISRGYLEAPVGGLAKAETHGLGLATEAKNNGSTGVSAEMWITDFRIMDQ